MKNFYFVLSFNISNPTVKAMLNRQSLFSAREIMVDFKVRSKPYMSFTEAMIASHTDFQNKLKALYPPMENRRESDKKDKIEDKHHVRHVCVINPNFISPGPDISQEIAARFGYEALNDWSEDCCGVLFFATADEEDDTDSTMSPNSWMMKYEVMTFNDAIELSSNGDFVFSPMNVSRELSSTFH